MTGSLDQHFTLVSARKNRGADHWDKKHSQGKVVGRTCYSNWALGLAALIIPVLGQMK
jgi:hypothetical protein